METAAAIRRRVGRAGRRGGRSRACRGAGAAGRRLVRGPAARRRQRGRRLPRGGHRRRHPVPQLLAFLPWLLVPAVLGLLLSAVARWPAGCVWALLAAALTGWFVHPYDSAASTVGGSAHTHRNGTVRRWRGCGCSRRTWSSAARRTGCWPRCAANAPTWWRSRSATGGARGRWTPRGCAPRTRTATSSPANLRGLRDPQPPSAHRAAGRTRRVGDAGGGGARRRAAGTVPGRPPDAAVPGRRRHLAPRAGAAARVRGGPGDATTVIAGDFNASQDHAAFRALLDTGMRDSARAAGAARTRPGRA
ncbi:hypothetical protein NKH77_27335 [Streptomyces sp. M19]